MYTYWAHPACHSTAIVTSFLELKLSDCEANHYHLILRLRMSDAVTPVPYIPLWPTQGLHLYIYIYTHIYIR